MTPPEIAESIVAQWRKERFISIEPATDLVIKRFAEAIQRERDEADKEPSLIRQMLQEAEPNAISGRVAAATVISQRNESLAREKKLREALEDACPEENLRMQGDLCVWCGQQPDEPDEASGHHPKCPWVQARAALAETEPKVQE